MKINKIIFKDREAVLNIINDKNELLGMFFVTDKQLIKSLRTWDIKDYELVFREMTSSLPDGEEGVFLPMDDKK